MSDYAIPNITPRARDKAMRLILEKGGTCAGCDRKLKRSNMAAVGFFIPNEPEKWVSAAPRANACRTMAYGVCKFCSDDFEKVSERFERTCESKGLSDAPIVDMRSIVDLRTKKKPRG